MIEIPSGIFKAYDVRGIVGKDLNAEIAYLFGRGLVRYLKCRDAVVGHDMRTSSGMLVSELIRGVTDEGCDVTDIGEVSTDGLYFAVGKYGHDCGVMVTASHNPPEYNGFKVCRTEAIPLSGDEGLNDIREIISKPLPVPKGGGRVSKKDYADAYTEHVLSFVDRRKIKPLKIVIDAGNGMAGKTVPAVFRQLPCELIPLFFDLDGTFPNHPASPIEPENIRDLQAKIRETDADLGAAFDGDADRMFLVDGDCNALGGDMVTAMVAKSLLKKALIKPLMKEHNAVFGGEHSGHFYFRNNWFADSGLIALLVCLELVSEESKTLSELVRVLDPYFRSGEINSRVDDVNAQIEKVKKAFSDGKQDTLDGVTVDYGDWWFNLRPSNTEPLLRLNLEANSRELLNKKLPEVLRIIREG